MTARHGFEIVLLAATTLMDSFICCVSELKVKVGYATLVLLLLLQSWTRVAIELFRSLVFFIRGKDHVKEWGFRQIATPEVSWSPPISKELIEAIREKSEYSCTVESILLVACSLALRDYYLHVS